MLNFHENIPADPGPRLHCNVPTATGQILEPTVTSFAHVSIAANKLRNNIVLNL